MNGERDKALSENLEGRRSNSECESSKFPYTNLLLCHKAAKAEDGGRVGGGKNEVVM